MQYKITRAKFDNKLSVIHTYLPHINSTTSTFWVKAGSTSEPTNRLQGIAHFLEHMMFNGTKKRSAEVAKQAISNLGGYENAYTFLSETIYYVQTPSKWSSEAFEILFDRVSNPLLSEKSLAKEKKVIEEEFLMSKDNPTRIVDENFDKLLFGNHNLYGHKVIGTLDSIRNMDIDDIRQFHKTYYSPNNCTVTIVTNIEYEKCLDIINKHVANFKPQKIPIIEFSKIISKKSQQISEITAKATSTTLQFGNFSANYSESDYIDLCLAISVLRNGKSSILVNTLKNNKGIISDINLDNVPIDRIASNLIFKYSGTTDNIIKAHNITKELVDGLKHEGFIDSDMTRGKALLKMKYIQDFETSDGTITSLLSPFREEVIGGMKYDLRERLDYIDSIDNRKLKAVLKKYFNFSNFKYSIVSNDSIAKSMLSKLNNS